MRYLLLVVVTTLFSCSIPKANQDWKGQLTVKNYRDRALCQCLVRSIDSTQNFSSVTQLLEYNPLAVAFYDPTIFKSLVPVFEEMRQDSIMRIGRVTEGAQELRVFKFCLDYYHSQELKTLAKREVKRVGRTKGLMDSIVARTTF